MKKGLWRVALFSSIFTLSLLGVVQLTLAPFVRALNPLQYLISDFEFSDLYYTKFYKNTEVDTTIALVNIASASRAELAEGIMQICAEEPAVLGLDFVLRDFRQTREDTLLRDAIHSCESVVFSHYVSREIDGSHEFFGGQPSGHNLLLTNEQGLVKEVEMDKGGPSFGQVILGSLGIPIPKRKKSIEIDPVGNYQNFLHTELQSQVDRAWSCRDKTVLLGYAGDYWGDRTSMEDKHYFITEFDIKNLHAPQTEGIVIHANILSNLRSGARVHAAGKLLNLTLAFLLLFACNWFFFYHFKDLSIRFILKCRVFQVVAVFILVFVVYWIFHQYRFKLNLAYVIGAPIASFDLATLYMACLVNLNKLVKLPESYILKKLEIQ